MIGIYCFTNRVNGNQYIGGSLDLNKRKSNHLSALKRKTHASIILQNAYNKYGQENFDFKIL